MNLTAKSSQMLFPARNPGQHAGHRGAGCRQIARWLAHGWAEQDSDTVLDSTRIEPGVRIHEIRVGPH